MRKNNFYAKGQSIFHKPVETKNDDGTSNIRMGFLVCEVSEFVNAKQVAEILNRGEAS